MCWPRLLYFGLGLTALLFVQNMLAQNATLSGRVVDQSQSAVRAASIVVENRRTSLTRSAQSNESGLYTLPELPPGTYDASISAPGFAAQHREIVLDVAQQAEGDFALAVGAIAQDIQVSGAPERLETSGGSVSNVVDPQLTANLPLNGRSFQNLITLAPGVALTNAENSSGQFTVNGLRATANSFSVDGVNTAGTIIGYQSAGGNNAGYNAAGGTNGMVPVDALEEFRVVTSSFAPEFGRNPGAHVLLLTKSGANQFHGTAFDYFRNDKLDAADWFVNQAAQSKPRLRSNDFGGVFAGPLVPNRAFFLLSYEGQRIREPQFAITDVPALAARQLAPAVAQPFLNAFPIPNGPELGNEGAQFSAGYSNPLATDSVLIKSEQAITDRLRTFASFTWAPSSKADRSNRGTASLADSNVEDFRQRSLTLGSSYTPTPSLADDLRLNFSDNVNQSHFEMDTFGGAVIPANYLLLPGTTAANYYSFVSLGYPGGDIFGGTSGVYRQRQINLVDSVTWIAESHQVKFGVDYRLELPIIQAAGDQYFQFEGVPGLENNLLAAFHNTAPSRARIAMASLSLYAQDSWKLTSSLNLTYGVRWDYNSVPRSRDPNNGDLVQLLGNYATNNVTIGPAGAPLWEQRYFNFAPRIGAAWTIRKSAGGEIVLRSGGGLFYDTGIAEASAQPWVSGYPAGQATVLLNSSLPVSPALAVPPPVNLADPPAGNQFFTFDPHLRAPRVWQWNVTLEQALGDAQTISLAYVGSQGRGLLYSVAYPEVTANIYPVVFTDNSGNSIYHSMQAHFERRLSHGIAANVSYTWSHSIDTNSSDTAIYTPTVYAPASSNRGDSDFDLRHILHAGFSWNLPSSRGSGEWKKLFTGWGLDGVVTAQSGLPINVTVRRDIGFGTYDFRPDLAAGIPVWIDDPNAGGGRRVNPAALVIPAAAIQGNLGRNALRGFGLEQIDVSLRRSFALTSGALTSRAALIFRADFFNALNHPNFSNPVGVLGSGLFGFSTASVANSEVGGGAFGLNSIFNIGGPRNVQLSLKLQF